MPAPQTGHALLALVRTSGLIDEGCLLAYLDKDPLPDDPKRAAKQMIDAGLLTRYQAQNLLGGRARGFFLDTYRLLEPVGHGGMGTVFLAEHTTLKRRVAIKVFSPERAKDPVALQRFYREGRAAAALEHPNIVRVYDIGHALKVHFLVMEFIDGRNLEQILAESGRLDVNQAILFGRQAAAALQHAAETGIVHRDIKPANLIIDAQGTLKVLDMGLARFFRDTKDDLTRRFDSEAVLGTADYIAPEQALNSQVDVRADIYSLGATLYTLLSGRPPFGGSSASAKLLAHQIRTPRRLHKVRPEVPRWLSDVIARMMAREPNDRYQTSQEVLEALSSPVPVGQPRPAPLTPPPLPRAKPSPPVSPSSALGGRMPATLAGGSRPRGLRKWPLIVAVILTAALLACGATWWLTA